MNVVPLVAIVLIAIALAVVARPTKVFAAVILLSILISTINYLQYTPPVQLFFFAVILFAVRPFLIPKIIGIPPAQLASNAIHLPFFWAAS